MAEITIPEFSFVVLIGASGSGKSTFAYRHFKQTEVISSDTCRGLISDDENNQAATKDAFDLLHYIASKRLSRKRLAVVDATNVQKEARKPLLDLAREYHALPVAIVLNMPERLCRDRNDVRPERANMRPHVISRQRSDLRRSLKHLKREGFRRVFVFNSPEEIEGLAINRERMWTDKRDEHGPFDIIGDVHGCFEELVSLLEKLGYEISISPDALGGAEGYVVDHPDGRKAVFLGDYCDRGRDTPGVLKLVMCMAEQKVAICLPGNHDIKLLRALKGRNVQHKHGLAESLKQIEGEPEAFQKRVISFLNGLISHYEFDDGKLVVAHGGMKAEMQGRASSAVRAFALYGDTTGETDEFGLPVRYNWAADYRGKSMVVYGHTPVTYPEWLNSTINIDTGCVFGGSLTALRYPELELVSEPAKLTYWEPARPFLEDEMRAPSLTAQQSLDDMLDIADVIGKRIISTGNIPQIIIREENSITALEVMSRFAINPKWLIYLPPTMSPSETSKLPGLLEHPAEAFDYYRNEGVPKVICEEKHMGSRAILVVCKDEEAARDRFGMSQEGIGVCYTRTGRQFFDDFELNSNLNTRVRDAITASELWEELGTDWVCLDTELMPWSAKAQELLNNQYAPVGAAARASILDVVGSLEGAASRGIDVSELLADVKEREVAISRYADAYRPYAWPVDTLSDLKIAPFHLIASENAVHVDKDHIWHMEILKKLCEQDDELLLATDYKVIDVTDPKSEADGVAWWESLTTQGGEGMVIKPISFITHGRRGMAQPAIKCRGKEYLRIIYGPEYDLPRHLNRLRNRGVGRKRSLASREFALGIEAVSRFVRREPLRRVHECVFGVLALESEPVDPRL
jgi:protein phosphatase